MKRLIFLYSLLLIAPMSWSQAYYLVWLADKNHSTYSISHPTEFLSQRAIERRQKYGIAINTSDLPVSQAYIDSIKNTGVAIHTKSKWLNTVTVKTSDFDDIVQISKLPFVVKIKETKPDISLKTQNINDKFSDIEDITTDEVSPITNLYGLGESQIKMLNGHILHEQGYRGNGIHIAVIDAGFYNVNQLIGFDSLWRNNQILGYHDFVDNDNTVFDAHTHGMNVLSIIGANIPGKLIGTAPKASFWLLRSEDTATEYTVEEDNWVAAIEFADSAGVDVVNTSLGYTQFDAPEQDYAYSDMNGKTTRVSIAAGIAAEKGLLIIASAGNEGAKSWKYIVSPGDAKNILTIGAVNSEGNSAGFSSFGPSIDGRVKPNIVAQGSGTALQLPNNTFGLGSGTSFSAPVITGMVACLWQAHPEYTNLQIIDAIERSSNRYNNSDTKFGYGIPDFALAHDYLSLNKEKKSSRIVAYPNPFRDNLTINVNLTNQPQYRLEVLDLLGRRTVLGFATPTGYEAFQQFRIDDLNSFEQGIYIFRVISGKDTYSVKVVKE